MANRQKTVAFIDGQAIGLGGSEIDLTKALSKNYTLVKKRWFHKALEFMFRRRKLVVVGTIAIQFVICCDQAGNVFLGRTRIAED